MSPTSSCKDASPTMDESSITNGNRDTTSQQHLHFKYLRLGPSAFVKKYLWTEQNLKKGTNKVVSPSDSDTNFLEKIVTSHRRLLGFAIPAIFFHFLWWSYMIQHGAWQIFPRRYSMSITMIFGSVIAGMTSEGGGAVAFPIMTLALGIKASVARDFSVMIQSCGMTAASFTIFFMRVQVEFCSVICCSIGGIAGLIFGLHVVDAHLTPQYKKMGFVSIWFAFASVLGFLNHYKKRQTFSAIQNINLWKIATLVGAGFVGGIFTSFSGSGLDVCSFSILTLLFRVSERVATPTSVILMAFNSIMCTYWRGVVLQEITTESWEFLLVCLPVVVIGAPVGSILGSHFHRLVLAGLVIVLDSVALISAFVVVKPMTPQLIGISLGIIVVGFCFFGCVTYLGERLMRRSQGSDRYHQPDGVPEVSITLSVNCESDNEDCVLSTLNNSK